MAAQTFMSFAVSADLLRMIKQRAKQEGVTYSDYIRESILFEMLFSGDAEAVKFVQKKIGKRVRGMLVDKLNHATGRDEVIPLLKAG